MSYVTARRVSQVFFLALFLWLCAVCSFGERWWQLRGWPAELFLQLDPLLALGTVLATHALYSGLLWALATIVLTIALGRVFCGWVCPLGTIQQAVGVLGKRGLPAASKIAANRYRRAQSAKYYVLFFLLGASATLGPLAPGAPAAAASLLQGLLDPIPLAHRSIDLLLLPWLDSGLDRLGARGRHYQTGWLIGTVFLAAVLTSLWIPRFYCRFVCPLGALLGIFGRHALVRIGKKGQACTSCALCEAHCEGACEPASTIRTAECVLCMNCLEDCGHGFVLARAARSTRAEIAAPDISRRGFVVSMASGLAAVPMLRLGGALGRNFAPRLIRPPGSLREEEFLARCTRCGRCMRICPTNVLQPAALEAGLEALWTPVLNNRIGTSACQPNCVACGQVCPTAAIRPIGIDEKLGTGEFAGAGPIRIGTAFLDRGRCLPWAMDRPCIVCQETCPVSPKAIFLRERFRVIRGGVLEVAGASAFTLELSGRPLEPGLLSTGDHFVRVVGRPGTERRRIVENGPGSVTVSRERPFAPPPARGSPVEIEVRLQLPYVDVERCTGCGICEHECPVSGLCAIRVTAENETRSAERSLVP